MMKNLNMRLAGLVSIGLAAWQVLGAERPLLVFCEDDSHYFGQSSAYANEASLRSYLREIASGGGVTHFFMCPNAMRANFASRVIEPAWAPCDVPGWRQTGWSRMLKTFNDAGIDPYSVWADESRKAGVSPWLSMRMNDTHWVTDPKYGGHDKFWRDHPEYWCTPNYTGKNWEEYALDYSHAAVRERALSFIEELLERYDVDGIECDWMRFPNHFPRSMARQCAPLLTDFMCRVRKIADAAARRRGHPVLVGARVASSYAGALLLGSDPVAWARAGAIDWLVPCNFWGTSDFDLDFADWSVRMRMANTRVRVIPGTDTNVAVEPKVQHRGLTLLEYRGWCDTQYAQGATGVYLFNSFSFAPTSKIGRAIRTGGLSPSSVSAAAERAYPLSWRECMPKGMDGGQTGGLVGEGQTFRIRLGNPPPARTAELLLAFDAEVSPTLIKGTTLNAARPRSVVREENPSWLSSKTKARSAWRVVFDAAVLLPGTNVVGVPCLGKGPVRSLVCELETKGRIE